jgi:hypothetical protein
VKPTSRKRKPAAVKEEATRLHSRIVRELKGPLCQSCRERPAEDAAHIIGRSYAHTRTDIDNAFALCKVCHQHFTAFSDAWMCFVDVAIGRPEYVRLKRKALDGVGQKFDWFDELDRLRVIAESVGVREGAR